MLLFPAGSLFGSNSTGYAHIPNVAAAFWLVEAIMPLVWAQAPDVKCLLMGSTMPLAERAAERPGAAAPGLPAIDLSPACRRSVP